ncbi:MAG: hypothetical protein H0W12_11120 [Chitinophagaceae bacterium]|nr:hypothetical protein [Chitinophagaceae bacterium]
MKKIFFLFIMFYSVVSLSQSPDPYVNSYWTWMKGDNVTNSFGVYGTIGVSGAANKPGAREDAISWTDSLGNLWLFGGYGYAASGARGYLDDLWKYNISTNQWTWIKGDSIKDISGNYGTKGLASPTNQPGARSQSISWIDKSGNLWLFGGAVITASRNDLWKYDPTINEWTWMSGTNVAVDPGSYGIKGIEAPGNLPGAGYASISWTDNTGNLWLFGGSRIGVNGFGLLNDLWKFNLVSKQWTWIKGDSATNIPGIYGIPGTPATANKPGCRASSISWTDSIGDLWLYGGNGFAASGSSGFLNDLWKYNIASKQWTWEKGDTSTGILGVYGTKGTPSSSNKPGCRSDGVSWTDHAGNLWLFGGNGKIVTGGTASFNDLWKYKVSTNQWTWIKGGNAGNDQDVYGQQGIEDAANTPGARSSSVSWFDLTGSLWLSGGKNLGGADYNDLWKIYGGLTYIFNGTGSWETNSNWLNKLTGPKNIPAGTSVIVDNSVPGQCDETGNINIQEFALLTIRTGKILNILNGNLSNAGILGGSGIVNFSGGPPASLSSSGLLSTPMTISNKQMFLSGNTSTTNTITLSSNATIMLNKFNLDMGGAALSGADKNNFIITNDSGILIRRVLTKNVLFPVGTSLTSYTPAIINSATSGVSDTIGVRVAKWVLSTGRVNGNPIINGTVNLTWLVTRETTSGTGNINLTVQWDQLDEQTGFDRTDCYISHYQVCPPPVNCSDGFYDAAARSAATGTLPGPFTLTRNNITSFNSPSFIVSSLPVPYNFINAMGNGDWSDTRNWTNERVPPSVGTETIISDGMDVLINPVSGDCTYIGTITVQPGGKLTIQSGKKLIIKPN